MRLALLAVVAFVAAATSSLIYWQMIVPQLPGLRRVPLTWWALQSLPVALVVIWAGYQARSFSRVLASAAVIVLPWVLVEASYGIITGRPVSHDVWTTDPAYWLLVTVQVVACAGVLGVVALAFRWIRRLAAGEETRAVQL